MRHRVAQGASRAFGPVGARGEATAARWCRAGSSRPATTREAEARRPPGPGPFTGGDGRIDVLDDRFPPSGSPTPVSLRLDDEPNTPPFDDDGLALLGGVEDFGKPLSGLRGAIPFHVHIVHERSPAERRRHDALLSSRAGPPDSMERRRVRAAALPRNPSWGRYQRGPSRPRPT